MNSQTANWTQLALPMPLTTAPVAKTAAEEERERLRKEALVLLSAGLSTTDWMVIHVGPNVECAICGGRVGIDCDCNPPLPMTDIRFGQVMENIGEAVQQLVENEFFPAGTVIAARLRLQRTEEPVTFYQVTQGGEEGEKWEMVVKRSYEIEGQVDWKRLVTLLNQRARYAEKKRISLEAWNFGDDQ